MKQWYWTMALAAVTGAARGQGLEGRLELCRERLGYWHETFVFNGSRFEYDYGGCKGAGNGSGTYRFTGDTLTLHFKAGPATAVTVRPAPAGPVPTFRFRVRSSSNGRPLQGATIASLCYPQLKAVTDSAGRAALAYPQLDQQSGDAFQLTHHYQATAIYLPVASTGAQEYDILFEPNSRVPQGEVYQYFVVHKTPEYLVMRRTNGPHPDKLFQFFDWVQPGAKNQEKHRHRREDKAWYQHDAKP